MLNLAAYYLKKYYVKVRDAIKSANDIILDDRGRILTWNKSLQQLEGYNSDEIVGKPLDLLYLPQERQSKVPDKLLMRAKEKGSSRQFGQFLRKDGGTFWGVLRLTAIKKDDKHLLGYVASWQQVQTG